MIKKILEKICNGSGILPYLLKYIIGKLDNIFNFSSTLLVMTNSSDRPNYAYCMYHAAILAKKLGHNSVSLVEFGVAGGNGIIFLERFAKKVEKELEIKIEIYGFDLEDGLSKPKNYKDLKYWFKEGYYKMNKLKLEKKIHKSKLIIGDVSKTLNKFFDEFNPAPIGAIFHDLDFYHSTIDSFKIFNGEEKYFLPRVYNYFDDILGSELEMYNEFTGELLAIEDFNSENKFKKIVINKNLVTSNNEKWRSQIYHFHNFSHSDYNKYIGGQEQDYLNKNIGLR